MNRLTYPSETAEAPKKSRAVLADAQRRWGFVPALYRLLSLSPAALRGLSGMARALDRAALAPAMRRRIALAISEFHGCDYCLSANTFAARAGALLDDAEITANRSGWSNDVKAEAAVRFALEVTRARGRVCDADVAAVRQAGFSDAQILEIVIQVGLTTATNYANEVAQTGIDFPVVRARNNTGGASVPRPADTARFVSRRTTRESAHTQV